MPRSLPDFIQGTDCLLGQLGQIGLRGFLFAVLTSPETIPPSDWTELLLDSKEPLFTNKDEAIEVMRLLGTEYNRINAAVLDGVGVTPEDCPIREDPMANFDVTAPLSQWSEGFRIGFEWLAEVWDSAASELEARKIRTLTASLTLFSSRAYAVEMITGAGFDESELKGIASLACWNFYDTCRVIASVGKSLSERSESWTGEFVAGSVGGDGAPLGFGKVDRNDPCPCGSGKKFKHCHGRSNPGRS